MARSLRISFDGAFHHVTNRGIRRQPIFIDDDDRLDFIRLLAKANERFGCLVNAFVLMGNHFHIVLETPDARLSEIMHLLQGNYVQRFNRRHGFDGPLFKDRFYSKLIETNAYVERAVTYVHRNPLDAGMVDELERYKWSSYPMFLASKRLRPAWLSDRALRIGGVRSKADLRQVTERGIAERTFDLADYGAVIGSDKYIEAVLANVQINGQTASHLRQATRRPSIAEIERAVADFMGVERESLVFRMPTSAGTLARMMSVSLCQDVGGFPLAVIAARYNYASAQSAGAAASRFRKRVENDLRLEACVREIIARILVSDG